MDPISVTASLAALAQSATSISRRILHGYDSAKLDRTDISELVVSADLLAEIHGYPLSDEAMPKAVVSCLMFCHEQMKRLEVFMVDSEKTKGFKLRLLGSKDAIKAIKGFTRAVNMLRGIVMDATTHKLLREHHLTYRMELRGIGDELRYCINILRDEVEQGRHLDSEQHRTGLNDLADRLRSMTERNASRTTDWRPDTADQFSFSATILHPHVEDSEYTIARGKFDTGCDENWISMDVLQRAGIDHCLVLVEIKRSYVAFSGQEFEPSGQIEITWYAENAGKSRKTTFLVHHHVPFDIVLGRIFIAEESIFVFNKPALALRMGKFTKEEHRIIEENARKKGATNDQLSIIRRAEEASARDRLRQQKAASIVASSIGSPGNRSTISLVSSRFPSSDNSRQPREVISTSGGSSRSVITQP